MLIVLKKITKFVMWLKASIKHMKIKHQHNYTWSTNYQEAKFVINLQLTISSVIVHWLDGGHFINFPLSWCLDQP